MYAKALLQPFAAIIFKAIDDAGINKKVIYMDIITTALSVVVKPYPSSSWTQFRDSVKKDWEGGKD